MLPLARFAPLVLAFTLAAPSSARDAEPKPTPDPDANYVTEKGFKSKIVEVKNRDVSDVAQTLSLLGSGAKGAGIYPNRTLKTLTIRDFPENVAAMEDALKRLDVPQPAAPRLDVELHMYVILAGRGETAAPAGPVPAELTRVLEQLQKTLSYKSYGLAASIVQRFSGTEGGPMGSGVTEVPGPSPSFKNVEMEYLYGLRDTSVSQDDSGQALLRVNQFHFECKIGGESATITTALALRLGEQVVVGTSNLQNRGVAVVISAKRVD